MASPSGFLTRVGTGTPGLDALLGGGFPEGRLFLLHGAAGTGKTTLGFQFLLEGAKAGEKVLYISLLQSRSELEAIAASHGWCIDKVDTMEVPHAVNQSDSAEQTVFMPADVELSEAVDAIIAEIERARPHRLMLDSVSELALLVAHPTQLREQILKLKRTLDGLSCTTLLSAGDAGDEVLRPLQTLVHGIIGLSRCVPEYGAPRRLLEISKMRGMPFVGGYHDFVIRTGGLEVFPRPQPQTAGPMDKWVSVLSGVAELDQLLGGGLDFGTTCLILGTAGAGKSTIASVYASQAADSGTCCAVYCFDEQERTLLRRCSGLGLSLPKHVDSGRVSIHSLGAGEMSPGEFAHRILAEVSEQNARIVVIDSLTGYFNAMGQNGYTARQIHDLLSELTSRGVLTILIMTAHGMIGREATDLDASYLADTVMLVRHFEAGGELRRCLAVIKKRHGAHEQSIREFRTHSGRIEIGPPLRGFAAVLTGTPRFEGATTELFSSNDTSH